MSGFVTSPRMYIMEHPQLLLKAYKNRREVADVDEEEDEEDKDAEPTSSSDSEGSMVSGKHGGIMI